MANNFISDEDIQKVREASDILALFAERGPLKQRGRDYWCCCPIHNEKTPSCKIDASTQLWHCFGCGAGGDIFGFLMSADGMTFPEAVRYLADKNNVQITEVSDASGVTSSQKGRLKEICKATAEFYHTQLMRSKDAGAAEARAYLSGRGMGGEIPKQWNLGYAPGSGSLYHHLHSQGFKDDEMVLANVCTVGQNGKVRDRFYKRVMFPIADVQGDVIAFGGRIMGEGQPKYLNSNENPVFHKSNVLYGLDRAKTAMASTGVAVVVEGYTDVIGLHTSGITNAVATLGTALTRQHIRTISRHAKNRIIYLFDGDAAGQHAAERALGFIDETIAPESSANAAELCAVVLPDDLDPADFVCKRGADELRELLAHAKPLLEFGIERCIASYDLSTPGGRSAAAAKALQLLAPIKESFLAKDYAMRIAGMTGVREDDALTRLSQLKADARRSDEAKSGSPSFGALPHESPATVPRRVNLTPAEVNRRRFERDLLSLLAQNPLEALTNADAVCAIDWHEPLHAKLSGALFMYLCDNPDSSAAALIARMQEVDPRAASMLTGSSVSEAYSVASYVRFIIEELQIGDLEEQIAQTRIQLNTMTPLDQDAYDAVFAQAVALQKDYMQLKSRHKA